MGVFEPDYLDYLLGLYPSMPTIDNVYCEEGCARCDYTSGQCIVFEQVTCNSPAELNEFTNTCQYNNLMVEDYKNCKNLVNNTCLECKDG